MKDEIAGEAVKLGNRQRRWRAMGSVGALAIGMR